MSIYLDQPTEWTPTVSALPAWHPVDAEPTLVAAPPVEPEVDDVPSTPVPDDGDAPLDDPADDAGNDSDPYILVGTDGADRFEFADYSGVDTYIIANFETGKDVIVVDAAKAEIDGIHMADWDVWANGDADAGSTAYDAGNTDVLYVGDLLRVQLTNDDGDAVALDASDLVVV